MKPSLISFSLASVLALSPLVASPALAQTQTNAQIEAIQDMAAWMQDALKIQTDMMSLFNPDLMQEMYTVLDSGDTAEISRFGQKFEANRQVILNRAKLQIAALPRPERWNIDPRFFSKSEAGLHRAAITQYESMTETYDEYETLSKSLSGVLTNVERLDEAAIATMQDIQITSAIKMIEIENRQVDGYLVALEETNPNYQFQKIVKQVNLSAIPEMELSHLSNADLEVRQDYGRKMRNELQPIKYLIRKGRTNLKIQIANLDALESEKLSAADQVFLPKLYDLYGTFDETFDIEEKILKSLMSNAKLYMSDEEEDAISAEVDQNNLIFLQLVEERVRLLNTRVQLIQ